MSSIKSYFSVCNRRSCYIHWPFFVLGGYWKCLSLEYWRFQNRDITLLILSNFSLLISLLISLIIYINKANSADDPSRYPLPPFLLSFFPSFQHHPEASSPTPCKAISPSRSLFSLLHKHFLLLTPIDGTENVQPSHEFSSLLDELSTYIVSNS